MIKLAIIEDNVAYLKALQTFIKHTPDIEVVYSGSNLLSFIDDFSTINPDVIIMDIDLPEISGIEGVRIIKKKFPATNIFMLTVFEESETVLNAIFAGASGYLLKKHLNDRLFPSMNEVLSGGAPMSPSIARLVISNMHTSSPKKNKYDLTTREKEILTALSDGSSYKIIGEKLFISIDTVRSHLKNIYKKLHVHSQTEAVAKALNERIL